jgi:hypothetical protein
MKINIQARLQNKVFLISMPVYQKSDSYSVKKENFKS